MTIWIPTVFPITRRARVGRIGCKTGTIDRGGYDGLMKLIKTGVLPTSIIDFIGTGLTQTQREMIGLVPQDPRAGS